VNFESNCFLEKKQSLVKGFVDLLVEWLVCLYVYDVLLLM
jgi:hypothetical protein